MAVSPKPTSGEFRLHLTITLPWPTSRYLSPSPHGGLPGLSSIRIRQKLLQHRLLSTRASYKYVIVIFRSRRPPEK
jgi:hypothetical protein